MLAVGIVAVILSVLLFFYVVSSGDEASVRLLLRCVTIVHNATPSNRAKIVRQQRIDSNGMVEAEKTRPSSAASAATCPGATVSSENTVNAAAFPGFSRGNASTGVAH